MYDVVHEDTRKAKSPPPRAKDGPEEEYDVLHSTVNKAQLAESQPQRDPPTTVYAVIQKKPVASNNSKMKPTETDSLHERSSDTNSKPIKKQKKGKKKKSPETEVDDPPPIPPQIYINQEELMPSQYPMQRANQSELAEVPPQSNNGNFPCYPDSMYDVVTH